MAVEELFFNTNLTTGSRWPRRGIILLPAAVRLDDFRVYPLQIKQLCGVRPAEKNQVIEW
jgi:Holliday junction resolvasome RuvABC endonuclease subunit